MNINHKMLLLFLLVLSSFSIKAQDTHCSFVIKKVTAHVYAAHQERVRRINSTSVIIVGTNFLTVIESQTDSATAAELIRQIRSRISTLPIKYLVFTHAHSDHISGAAAFVKKNPSVTIVAHQKTAEHMAQYGKAEQTAWAGFIKQRSVEAKKQAAAFSDEQRRNHQLQLASDLDKYYRDVKSSPIIQPTLTFADSLTLHDAGLDIQLKYFGAGHTTGDIVAYIPQEKVLVTGDLVHDFEPLFPDADPESWMRVLEKLKQIDFDYFIGGHGDVEQGKDILYAWLNYMKELTGKTKDAIRTGLALQQFQNRIKPESFTSLQNGYAEHIQKYRTSLMDYWTGPLSDAIKDEAASLWKYYSGGR